MRASLAETPSAPSHGPLTRVLTVCIAVILTIGLCSVPAHADYYSGGVGSPRFSVRYTGVNDTYVNRFNTSRGNWNRTTNTNVSITRSTSSSVNRTMTAARYNDSWYGLYTPSGTRNNRRFVIRVNARTLARDSGSNMTAWILSTTVHELGHALSLADNPRTSSLSIMKHNRNRTRTTPYAYDVSEVRRIY
ncbi:zinc metalloprotease [Nocardiopsis valliformis]|uniref:hypothetical protein n=1 Tax=Nocardiopsis valliformis TaxID=239974 RepID=UPI000344B184|nr:hypothetical protein [Nocardiopsis valliformis]